MTTMTVEEFNALKRRISRKGGHGKIKRHATRTKAEAAVLAALEDGAGGRPPYRIAQQVRNLFPMEGGGEYIPDFVLLRPDGGITVIEAKGGYKGPGAEQGHERYARAAALYSTPACAFEKWIVARDGSITVEEWEGE